MNGIIKAIGHYRKDAYHRVIMALLFGILFTGAGWVVPRVYFQYIDTKDYYVLDNPILVDSETYTACGEVKMIVHRVSYFNGVARKVEELVRINGGNVVESKNVSDFHVGMGEETLIVGHDIPCDTPSGKYVILGAIEYRVNGVTKTDAFATESFEIVAE